MKRILNNLFFKDEDRCTILFNVIFIIAIFSFVFLRLKYLNRGFISSDEGFYVCLLRDCPTSGIYRFQLLFRGLFQDDVYLIRLTCYLLNLISNIVFSLGLFIYVNKKISSPLSLLSILGLVCLGQQYILACPSLNYITLNFIICQLSLGFLLIASYYNNKLLYFFSGFIIMFLFPVMITNLVIIAAILLFVYFTNYKSERYLLSFFLGVIFFFLFYFFFLDSFSDFCHFFTVEASKAIHSGTSQHEHGLLILLNWTKETVIFLVKRFVFAIIICFLYKKIRSRFNKVLYQIIFVSLCIVLFLLLKSYLCDFKIDLHWVNDRIKDIYLIMIFFFVLLHKLWENKDLFALVCLLFSCPLALSLGTNVPFNIRMGSYFAFVIPLLFITNNKQNFFKYIILMIFMINIICFWNYDINWHGDSLKQQNIPVNEIGIKQNIYVNQVYANKIAFVKQILKPNDKVLNDVESWGFVSLLKLRPLRYNFNLYDTDIRELITESIKNHEEFYLILNPVNSAELHETINELISFDKEIIRDSNSNLTIIKFNPQSLNL